jgi:hypothetical protein
MTQNKFNQTLSDSQPEIEEDFGGGGYPATPKYKIGDSVYVRNYQGIGKIAYIKHRGDVGVKFKEPSHPRVVTTIDDLKPAHSVAEQEKVGNMDADRFDDAIARLKQLAGAGPLKTVWDPKQRVYRNMPTAVQPPKSNH